MKYAAGRFTAFYSAGEESKQSITYTSFIKYARMITTEEIVIYFFIAIIIIAAFALKEAGSILKKNNDIKNAYSEINEDISFTRYFLVVIAGISLLAFFLFPYLEKKGLAANVLEWTNIVVRWAHVVLGIAWIGASFYFIFLENSLNRTKGLRDELAGNLWAIHGGGFYYIEKYKGAPKVFPEKLHWFKYEAYFTWLTGVLLLILVYYMNAKSFMIDPAVSDITPATAVFIGIGSMLFGWFIYDWMCRSSLLSKPKLFGLIGFLVLLLFSFVLTRFLSGRAAFIHVGALLGTIMAGNVFAVIIPSQKALVRAALQNLPPDFSLGKNAGLRSLHNNYITLPVIFIMISNHFPGTYAPVYNWLILAGLILGSVAVRHYINMHEKGINAAWFLVFAAIALFALVFVTSPSPKSVDTTPVKFSEVQTIITKRCISCHSSNPTDDEQKVAPNGVILETPQQIAAMKDRILFRVVQTKTMPQGNKTGITEEERLALGRWIEQGALTSSASN